jgi:hypothetical protein
MQSFETFGFDSSSDDDLPSYKSILRKYRMDEFALLCSSLRQNDPLITKVKATQSVTSQRATDGFWVNLCGIAVTCKKYHFDWAHS